MTPPGSWNSSCSIDLSNVIDWYKNVNYAKMLMSSGRTSLNDESWTSSCNYNNSTGVLSFSTSSSQKSMNLVYFVAYIPDLK